MMNMVQNTVFGRLMPQELKFDTKPSRFDKYVYYKHFTRNSYL